MQKKDDDHPIGVCQRFFYLLSRITRIITPFLHSAPPVMIRRLMDEDRRPKRPSKSIREEKLNHQDQKMSKDDLGSAIEIHFRPTEEDLEHWTPVHFDHYASQIRKDDDNASTSSSMASYIDKAKEKLHKAKEKEKNSKVAEPTAAKNMAKEKKSKIGDPPRNKELPLFQENGTSIPQGKKRADPISQGRGFQETPQVAQARGTEKVVSTDNKGKNIASKQINLPIQDKGPKMRNRENILSANINEKSDAFIRSRKEAMRRNLGLGPEEELY